MKIHSFRTNRNHKKTTSKKLLIHDVSPSAALRLFPRCTEENGWIVIGPENPIHHCIGCFGCWVKTPGICVLSDNYSSMGSWIAECNEIFLVSRCCYGGPSPFIKNVLDRSISYIHPYFVIRKGEMHHLQRYNNPLTMNLLLYGENLTPEEKQSAAHWIQRVAINLEGQVKSVLFKDLGSPEVSL